MSYLVFIGGVMTVLACIIALEQIERERGKI